MKKGGLADLSSVQPSGFAVRRCRRAGGDRNLARVRFAGESSRRGVLYFIVRCNGASRRLPTAGKRATI